MAEVVFSFAALMCLAPMLALPYRGLTGEDAAALERPRRFWAALGLAVAGPAVRV